MNPDLSKKYLVHFVEDLSPISGGVATFINTFCQELTNNNLHHTIICNKAIDIDIDIQESADVNVFVPKERSFGWGYSQEMYNFISNISLKPNTIFHVHGVWKAIHFFAVKIANTNNVPCVLTPHGMLDPWLWNSQGIIKKVKKHMYWFIFANYFKKVDLLHAITHGEQDNLNKLLPNLNIVRIPNTISTESSKRSSKKFSTPQKYILFLGRITPVKGLDILLKAFKGSGLNVSFRLLIVGPIDDEGYWQSILKYIDDNNLNDCISYLGSKFGEEKDNIISKAWVCAVPSRVEAIGMVNLEAANLYCPSITSFETGLYDWEEGGGLLVEADSISSCTDALQTVGNWSLEERLLNGDKSNALVAKKYNIKKINKQWNVVYEKLLN